jgi:hypothetical protein
VPQDGVFQPDQTHRAVDAAEGKDSEVVVGWVESEPAPGSREEQNQTRTPGAQIKQQNQRQTQFILLYETEQNKPGKQTTNSAVIAPRGLHMVTNYTAPVYLVPAHTEKSGDNFFWMEPSRSR